MSIRNIIGAASAAGLLLVAVPASAAVIVLDFEGLQNLEPVENFYNGGLGGNGSGPGTDFGITFNPDALAIIDFDAGGTGNFGGEPSPDTVLFFLSGSAAVMTVASGFDTGFSFFYSAINTPGSVDVFDGPNGTGNVLTSLALPVTPSDGGDPTGAFSPFVPIGVAFGGTAQSVAFAGAQDQIGFDDITFGSTTPGQQVPEPATLGLIGAGLLGFAMTRNRRKA